MFYIAMNCVICVSTVIQMRQMVPEGMCVHVSSGKTHDQALEVFNHFNIEVTLCDIFSRCQVHSCVSFNDCLHCKCCFLRCAIAMLMC